MNGKQHDDTLDATRNSNSFDAEAAIGGNFAARNGANESAFDSFPHTTVADEAAQAAATRSQH